MHLLEDYFRTDNNYCIISIYVQIIWVKCLNLITKS